MANSYVTYTGNGTTQTFGVTFPYINQSEVSCLVNGQAVSFIWPTSTSITLTTPPGNGAQVVIQRATAIAAQDVTFADGTTIRAADLNLAIQQLLYGLQDAQDNYNAGLQAALGRTGQLPGVSGADNGSLLGVVGGVWAKGTTASFGFTSAAFTALGTGPSQIPLNSNLGTAAYVNTGTAAGQVPLNSNLGSAAYLPTTGFVRVLSLNNAMSASLTNITTATPFGVTYTIPANYFSAQGKAIRIKAGGTLNCGVAQAVSVSINIGGNLFQSVTFSASAGNNGYWVEAIVTLHSAPGTSAQVGIIADFALGTSSGATDNPTVGYDYTYNTTIAQNIVISAASGTANNSCVLNTLLVEALN